ncbi:MULTISPECIES: SDR family NAD(P)-dependent oxidoreductase [unclassified Cryobacterium]|uniref:SDR family NAD(P)-dependent oxidoreductase n=1 Tax=unclassified Cryobacterium TaxID=2649013 RepID=UPI000CE2CF18|nr:MULTISPECIES: SDR family NAD(P)-dependent oxidoreductase [unclassified Cryobacterium]
MASEVGGLPVGSLAERVVVITGAGSGLGRAAAELFAGRGAHIVAVDLAVDSASGTIDGLLGEGHLALQVDVSLQPSVDALTAAVLARFGRIDVLVNSAGIAEGRAPTLEQDLEHWQRIIDVNLTGSYLMCQATARIMRETGGGVILNLSSIAGVIGLPRRTAYSASKGGVSMLTRVLASEWAPYGIRVNAVAPGYIHTAMTEKLMAEGRLDVDAIVRRSPTGEMGTATDVAEALAFLASDQARFITGVVLPVDGAYTAYGAPEDAFPGD